MALERKQYPTLDIAKFGCALLILLYHYFSDHGPVFWVLDEALSLYAVAVALFMTISGYLLFDKISRAQNQEEEWGIVKKQVGRILSIYLLWSVPYLLFRIYCWDWQSGVDLIFILTEVRDCVFQSTYYTIWFMPALAVATVIAYWMYRLLKWETVCVIALIFYLFGSLQATYSFALENSVIWRGFCSFSETWLQGPRGGLFFGMPLVVLGGCAVRIRWRKPAILAAASFVSMILLVGEAVLLRVLVGGCGLDLALMMVPTCLFIMLFLTSISWKSGKAYRWMRAMSVLIFMSQRLFLTVIPAFLPKAFLEQIFRNPYFGCVIVCGSTIIFDVLIFQLSKKVKFLRNLY